MNNNNTFKSIKGISNRAIIVILDGFGINPKAPQNAIVSAKKPNIDYLFSHYPYTTIQGSGVYVGLPDGIPGNSEVGHLNIGAGRPVRQDLVRINEAVKEKTLASMPKMKELIEKARASTKRIHLMGLLSDGGVHSDINHIAEVIRILSQEKDLQIFYHAFMDGRDTPTTNGAKYIKEIMKVPGFHFSSIQGRSIGMDRDKRWPKIEVAYKMMIGEGSITNITNTSTNTFGPVEYINEEYKKNIFDEFITPTLFNKDWAIKNDDTIFFLNFRPDRARQITMAFADSKFKEFATPVKAGYYLCMSPYFEEELPLPILFDKEKIKGTLSYFLSTKNIKHFKIAETEKYAHVTYFFNGGEEVPFPGEDRMLVPSPREVKTYDEKPQMSAYLVLDKLLENMNKSDYKFYLINFANPDMIGHTGNFQAAVKAIETVDECVGKIMQKCDEQNMTMILTSDHGNADQMALEDGSPHTSHTVSQVPFVIYNKAVLEDQKFEINKEGMGVDQGKIKASFALKDIAPTLLYVLDIESPSNFVGVNIFR
ncbi:MAG: 2,3-bisphosphoglycerate-independent phosphoglycerate mutase [Oligoflexia bacterium]|nr:2,3-bisphosphoglycerate-independent phosphoglycerate mutase [Oligoflexia bacterium]